MLPEIANVMHARQTHPAEFGEIQSSGGVSAVEETYGSSAVFQQLHIDVHRPARRRANRGDAAGVLIQRNHLIVGQQVQRELIGMTQIAADEQGSGKQRQ